MMNETEQRYTDALRCELEKYKKEAEELEYQYNRLRSENGRLKECVVRMCMERYGVLNE